MVWCERLHSLKCHGLTTSLHVPYPAWTMFAWIAESNSADTKPAVIAFETYLSRRHYCHLQSQG